MNSLKASVAVLCVALLWLYFRKLRNLSEYEKLAFADTPDIIKFYGYSTEDHVVLSDDGYKLVLHRIPSGRTNVEGKGPVLLQHAFLQSSADFVLAGPENSLAFLLADAGYDVWLYNRRGNTYSDKHQHIKSNDPAYWNFSFHEHSVYDTAATIDYILNSTARSQLVYVGYSYGGAVPFALTSEKPEYNTKMKIVVALTPMLCLDARSPYTRALLIGSHTYSSLLQKFGVNYMLQWRYTFGKIFPYLCSYLNGFPFICQKIMELVSWSSEGNINKMLLPVIHGHTPAGASRKCFEHMGQMILSGKFQKFDYGEGNMEFYGTETPPEYNLRNFNTKLIIYCADKDNIISCDCLQRVFAQFSHVEEKQFYTLVDTTHLDITYGKFIRRQLYDGLLQILDSQL